MARGQGTSGAKSPSQTGRLVCVWIWGVGVAGAWEPSPLVTPLWFLSSAHHGPREPLPAPSSRGGVWPGTPGALCPGKRRPRSLPCISGRTRSRHRDQGRVSDRPCGCFPAFISASKNREHAVIVSVDAETTFGKIYSLSLIKTPKLRKRRAHLGEGLSQNQQVMAFYRARPPGVPFMPETELAEGSVFLREVLAPLALQRAEDGEEKVAVVVICRG